MKKVIKVFKFLGWFMMIVCLGIFAVGMIFDAYILLPLSISLTAGTAFMFIGMTIEIIMDLLNR